MRMLTTPFAGEYGPGFAKAREFEVEEKTLKHRVPDYTDPLEAVQPESVTGTVENMLHRIRNRGSGIGIKLVDAETAPYLLADEQAVGIFMGPGNARKVIAPPVIMREFERLLAESGFRDVLSMN